MIYETKGPITMSAPNQGPTNFFLGIFLAKSTQLWKSSITIKIRDIPWGVWELLAVPSLRKRSTTKVNVNPQLKHSFLVVEPNGASNRNIRRRIY